MDFLCVEWGLTTNGLLRIKEPSINSELNPTLDPGIHNSIISVHPNPAKEFIVFDLTNILSSAIVELYDLQGKKVMEKKISGDKRVTIGNLPKGMYMYKLHNNGISYTGKLIFE